MGNWSRILVCVLVAVSLWACGEKKPATPVETFMTYVKAIKTKDVKTMKLLLSNATIKMHEQEAKAQNTTLDEIVKRETLVAQGQKSVDYRDEKINGEKATLQVKNSYGSWETMPFVREDGVWKIDKQGYADQIQKEVDEENRKTDDLFNINKTP